MRHIVEHATPDQLASLKYREREVIKLLYGIRGPVYSRAEVARIFRTDPDPIEASAIRKLRDMQGNADDITPAEWAARQQAKEQGIEQSVRNSDALKTIFTRTAIVCWETMVEYQNIYHAATEFFVDPWDMKTAICRNTTIRGFHFCYKNTLADYIPGVSGRGRSRVVYRSDGRVFPSVIAAAKDAGIPDDRLRYRMRQAIPTGGMLYSFTRPGGNDHGDTTVRPDASDAGAAAGGEAEEAAEATVRRGLQQAQGMGGGDDAGDGDLPAGADRERDEQQGQLHKAMAEGPGGKGNRRAARSRRQVHTPVPGPVDEIRAEVA